MTQYLSGLSVQTSLSAPVITAESSNVVLLALPLYVFLLIACTRDNIILMSQNLEELDDKPISGKERQFLLQLHIRKMKREQAEERRQRLAEGGGEQDEVR